jgi:hypothetical protein
MMPIFGGHFTYLPQFRPSVVVTPASAVTITPKNLNLIVTQIRQGTNYPPLIAVNLYRFDHIHLAVDAAGTIRLINGIARVFL